MQVLNGCGVIQGDGINYKTVDAILARTMAAGFSAQNVAFGMGGGLLQVRSINSIVFTRCRRLTATQ